MQRNVQDRQKTGLRNAKNGEQSYVNNGDSYTGKTASFK